jgi:hypothetical protein
MKFDILVPTSLNDITLEQYQKFEKINTEENQDSAFLMHKTVEIFCNLDLKDVAKVKFNYVKQILDDINNVFAHKTELIQTFKLGGQEYGFIPSLDEMTLGEYIDLDEYFSDWATMHKAMSVLFRKVKFKKGDKYQIEDYDGIKNDETFKKMPMDVVMGAVVFFWNLRSELLTTTLNYLQTQAPQNMTTQQQQLFQENGAGIKVFMDSAKAMLPKLTTLPN